MARRRRAPGAAARTRQVARGSQAPVVRLDSPRALVEAVPHLVGFVPEESLVAVLFDTVPGTTRYRSKATVRVDLPPLDQARQVWDAIVPGLVDRVRPAAVALIGWGAPNEPTNSPGHDLRASDSAGSVTEAAAAFVRCGVQVRDHILVSGGRFVSLDCTDRTCCPMEGLGWDAPDCSAVSAEVAVHGLPQPLASREMLQAVVAADDALVRAVSERLDADDLWSRSRQIGQPVIELVNGGARDGGPAVEQTVDVLIDLLSGRARDEAVLATLDAPDEVRPVWERLVRSAPEDVAPAPAALSALAAYLRGDGAAANVALDRAHVALDHVARSAWPPTRSDDAQGTREPQGLLPAALGGPTHKPTDQRPSIWDTLLAAPVGHPQLALVDNLTRLIGAGVPPSEVEEQLRSYYTRETLTRVWEG